MKALKFNNPEEPPVRRWLVALPLLPLLLAVLSDILIQPGFTLLPLACSFGLLGIGYFQKPKQALLWGAAYTLATLGALLLQRNLWADSDGNLGALIISRTLVIACSVILAYSIAVHRNKIDNILTDISRIFDQIKSPIIISDSNGWIIYANPSTKDIFSEPLIWNRPYFEVFTEHDGKGREVQRYVNLVTGVGNTPAVVKYSRRSGERKGFTASMDRLVIGKRSFLITIVFSDDHLPENT